MTNPYESAFGEENQPKPDKADQARLSAESPLEEFEDDGVELLDELLELCRKFSEQAGPFVQLLSKTRAVDHEVPALARRRWLQYLVSVDDPHRKKNLKEERVYYELLQKKFVQIIVPMKTLATQHLEAIKKYHNDIDEHYYSIHKTELQVKREVARAKEDILLQRRILFDAQEALSILTEALDATEKRMGEYVNVGGQNNISASELAVLSQERRRLTDGEIHQFNFGFFALNLLDKLSMQLQFLPKATTAQYLGQLSLALEARE